MISLRRDSAIVRLSRRPAVLILVILTAYICFTLATLPRSDFPFLSINRGMYETVTNTLPQDWKRLLWPMEYERGRIYWQPGTIFFIYAAERYLGPLPSYLLFSSIFIVASFTLSFVITRSLLFAGSLAFMFAFGTQLNYAYTYGSLIPLYLVQTYCALNLWIALSLLRQPIHGVIWSASFIFSFFLLALSSEWWINYAIALLAASVFGLLWALRHGDRHVFSACRFIIGSTILVLVLYLSVRLQYSGQFTTRGEEEELMVSYSSPVMMADDFITNYFTFLYMSLDNYLPSFVSASNSLVYIGPEKIIAEQNGYHAEYQNLVVMSHIFMWRFYAGVAATLFAGALLWAGSFAWRNRTPKAAIVVALMLMVATGFATHLLIKMRPYNSVPALSYKVVFSVAALTLLLSYLMVLARDWVGSAKVHRYLVASLLTCVFLAALTRPGMQAELLKQVGLLGLRDPLGQIVHLVRR